MSKLRFPALPQWLTYLFDLPITWSYAGRTLGLGSLVASIVFSPTALPALANYLVMLATMGWLARPCESAAQRWVWVGLVGLLTLGVSLEVGTCWLQ